MRCVCVIPARLASTRFPRKMVSHLGPKPLLQWVWEAACASPAFAEVVFAIDHREIAQLLDRLGAPYFFTSPHCQSGTDRLSELCLSGKLEGDLWVNWQGDEPLISKEMVAELLPSSLQPGVDVWTLKKKLSCWEEVENPNSVKVVTDLSGRALFFSRSPLPYQRDSSLPLSPYFRHIGLYAYTERALRAFATMEPTPLEKAESLEQLRFLEYGLTIKVHETSHQTIGIDHPSDSERAWKELQHRMAAPASSAPALLT